MKAHAPGTCHGFEPGPYRAGDCRVCWLVWAKEAGHDLKSRAESPSLLRKAANFAVAVVKHVAHGLPQTPPAEIERRQSICAQCEHQADGRCTHKQCGCFLKLKTAWLMERCPMGRWELPVVEVNAGESLAAGEPILRFNEHNFFPGLKGKRFNSSLMAHGDGYLLAFRDGWKGSEIHVATLGRDFQPQAIVQLKLWHVDANYGREDPRLFWYRDKLHVAYIGVVGDRRIHHTNVLYARLSADLQVERIFSPKYAGRNLWEKNWQFFEHADELFAIYSVAPHQVLRIDGDRAELVYKTQTPAPWSLPKSEMRGGASPVLVGDEWWCFFHSRATVKGRLTYVTGLYTFEARPPFRIQRIIPEPIQWADRATNTDGNYADVIFSCGAVCKDGRWLISSGEHDRTTRIDAFDHGELERRLVQIAPPHWWNCREDTIDTGVFAAVACQNEYRLPDRFDASDVVIDVGAHVGSFAFAAWSRGSRNVHCYEPSPANVRLLQQNAEQMSGVHVHDEAIGEGSLFFHAGDDWNTGSGRTSADPSPVPVNAVSLDSAIARAGGRVAFLKLDAEGAEYSAITKCQALYFVDRIALEFHGSDQNGPELARVLEDAGFEVNWTVGEYMDRGHLFARNLRAL